LLILGNVSILILTTTSTSIKVAVNDSSRQYKCWGTAVHAENEKERMQGETIGRNMKVFKGLKANTMYRIECEERKNRCFSGNTIIKTQIGAPGITKIENTTVSVTCTSITFSWIPPTNAGGDTIRSYTITYFTDSEEKSNITVQGNVTLVIIPNLSPNTRYSIQMRAHNSKEHGQQSSFSIPTAMRGLGSLIPTILSDTSIKVSHSLEEAYYTCEMNGSDHHFNVTGQGHNVTGLQPDTTYRLQCIAYLNGVDHCLEVDNIVKTCEKFTACFIVWNVLMMGNYNNKNYILLVLTT
jgi:hypothetical protein